MGWVSVPGASLPVPLLGSSSKDNKGASDPHQEGGGGWLLPQSCTQGTVSCPPRQLGTVNFPGAGGEAARTPTKIQKGSPEKVFLVLTLKKGTRGLYNL